MDLLNRSSKGVKKLRDVAHFLLNNIA